VENKTNKNQGENAKYVLRRKFLLQLEKLKKT
jgi:hypothetical protein